MAKIGILFQWEEARVLYSIVRSFGLTPKNQKVKAYTPAATNSRREVEISENSPTVQTAEISLASLGICFTPLGGGGGRTQNNI